AAVEESLAPELQIYNTLTRSKEKFTTLEPGVVKMYVCGVTVYDLCHIGHARVMVFFDTAVRFMRHMGYKVTFVRNVTDI
ncbi:cysS, partial [Symbiodinium necroappetens]